MRLLQVDSYELVEQPEPASSKDSNYAILSHTWGEEELSFQDFHPKPSIDHLLTKWAFLKIRYSNHQAVDDGLGLYWVDTCCIDKNNKPELDEAINSMYRWYQKAKVCYVYLSDVEAGPTWEAQFRRSRWFKRGWTLQELLAPRQVKFYDTVWNYLGSRSDLAGLISSVTKIDRRFLKQQASLDDYSIGQRMSWAAFRETTRPEDRAYSLLGIFSINMPLIYGEGGERAFRRLQEHIILQSTDHSILAWEHVANHSTSYDLEDVEENLPHSDSESDDENGDGDSGDIDSTFHQIPPLIAKQDGNMGEDCVHAEDRGIPTISDQAHVELDLLSSELDELSQHDSPDLSYLLAPSPDCFAECGNIVRTPGLQSDHFGFNNKGLSIKLRTLRSYAHPEQGIAILDCRFRHDCTMAISLRIRMTGPRLASSFHPFRLQRYEDFNECEIDGRLGRLCVIDAFKYGPLANLQNLILLRDRSQASQIPEFEIRAHMNQAKLVFDPSSVEVVDLFPSHLWNDLTMTITAQEIADSETKASAGFLCGGLTVFSRENDVSMNIGFRLRSFKHGDSPIWGSIRTARTSDANLESLCNSFSTDCALPLEGSVRSHNIELRARIKHTTYQGDNIAVIELSCAPEMLVWLTDLRAWAWAALVSPKREAFIITSIQMVLCTAALSFLLPTIMFLQTAMVGLLIVLVGKRAFSGANEMYRQRTDVLDLTDVHPWNTIEPLAIEPPVIGNRDDGAIWSRLSAAEVTASALGGNRKSFAF